MERKERFGWIFICATVAGFNVVRMGNIELQETEKKRIWIKHSLLQGTNLLCRRSGSFSRIYQIDSVWVVS
jgi:hypothetical protein